MSRPIKFRCWDEVKKEWFDYRRLHDIDHEDPTILELVDDGGFCTEQFTGLTDKNGKEIYEGDIIRSNHFGVYEVVFGDMKDSDNDYFYLGWAVRSKYGDLYSLYDFTTDEVVGNIHENPELLEAKSDGKS